ncbi:hypothetical protein MMC25_002471 [Agyrium rufum]|nr:hypothetical protein [Agyrium rufum]
MTSPAKAETDTKIVAGVPRESDRAVESFRRATKSATASSVLQSIRSQPTSYIRPSIHQPIPAVVSRQQYYQQHQYRNMASASTFYDFEPKDSRFDELPLVRNSCYTFLTIPASATEKGNPYPLVQTKGKVVLVVNTASKCGFTPQFTGLEALYKKITTEHPDKFLILGFPCNQFGNQDPGDDNTIQSFCQVNYGVTFPVLGKTDVNGDKAEPVFEFMKKEIPGLMGLKRIKWNFEKFLISADGKVVQRWGSITKPESLEQTIVDEIKKTSAAKAEL